MHDKGGQEAAALGEERVRLRVTADDRQAAGWAQQPRKLSSKRFSLGNRNTDI